MLVKKGERLNERLNTRKSEEGASKQDNGRKRRRVEMRENGMKETGKRWFCEWAGVRVVRVVEDCPIPHFS